MSLKQSDTILTDTPLAPVAGAVYSGGVPGVSKVIAVDANGVVQTSGGGGGGGGTQYAEDSPHASGDLGTGALGVRRDTVGSMVSADGDYTLFQFDSSGRARTQTVQYGTAGNPWFYSTVGAFEVPAMFLVDPFTLAIPAIIGTDPTGAENAWVTRPIARFENAINTALDFGVPAFGQLDDVATTAATENNVAPARITAQRAFHVNLRSNSGAEFGTTGNPFNIGSIAGSITPGTAKTELGKAWGDPLSGSGDVGVFCLGYDSLNGVTAPIEVADFLGDGNMRVRTATALEPSTTVIGAIYPVGGNIYDGNGTIRSVSRTFVNATATGDTAIVAAAGVGLRIRVLSLSVVTTLANSVKFRSGTTDITATYPLAANGGMVWPQSQHGYIQTATNTALNVNLSVATQTAVDVTYIVTT